MTTTSNEPAQALSHEFLTPQQVAAMLPGLTVKALAMWRYRHFGPPYRKLGAKIFYAVDELDAWVESEGHGGEFDD